MTFLEMAFLDTKQSRQRRNMRPCNIPKNSIQRHKVNMRRQYKTPLIMASKTLNNHFRVGQLVMNRIGPKRFSHAFGKRR